MYVWELLHEWVLDMRYCTLNYDSMRALIIQFGEKPMGYCAGKLMLSSTS